MDDNGVLADRGWRAERRLGVRYLTLSIASRCFISARLDGPVRNPSGFSTDLRRPGRTDPESYKMGQRRCCSVR
jgi:hypothetical protein